MINLDIRCTQGQEVEIAGDEEALLQLCSALKLCASNGFEVELEIASDSDPTPYNKLLAIIAISINDSKNAFSVSEKILIIEGDESFLSNLQSNIPWDAQDTHSGLSYHVHYDRISFGDYLDDESIDLILTKKRKS